MWSLLSRPTVARVVDNGRVFCPVRLEDVDLEACLSCAFLTKVKSGTQFPDEIVCRPSYASLISESGSW